MRDIRAALASGWPRKIFHERTKNPFRGGLRLLLWLEKAGELVHARRVDLFERLDAPTARALSFGPGGGLFGLAREVGWGHRRSESGRG
jgi:hypothetical protein